VKDTTINKEIRRAFK